MFPLRLSALVLACFSLLIGSPPSRQSLPAPTATRDSQAVTLVQNALRAMGSTVPTDSVATGNVTIVAGFETSSGTIRILTRSTYQTSEQITLSQATQTIVYSEGYASERDGDTTTSLSMERSLTSRSLSFPLPFLASILEDSTQTLQYVGLEKTDQAALQHIRLRATFSLQPKLQALADATTTDIWLDSATGLPQRISYLRRDQTGGPYPAVPVDYYFSEFRTVSGVLYPFHINISLNGTPWTDISITNVQFAVGLSDIDFLLK